MKRVPYAAAIVLGALLSAGSVRADTVLPTNQESALMQLLPDGERRSCLPEPEGDLSLCRERMRALAQRQLSAEAPPGALSEFEWDYLRRHPRLAEHPVVEAVLLAPESDPEYFGLLRGMIRQDLRGYLEQGPALGDREAVAAWIRAAEREGESSDRSENYSRGRRAAERLRDEAAPRTAPETAPAPPAPETAHDETDEAAAARVRGGFDNDGAIAGAEVPEPPPDAQSAPGADNGSDSPRGSPEDVAPTDRTHAPSLAAETPEEQPAAESASSASEDSDSGVGSALANVGTTVALAAGLGIVGFMMAGPAGMLAGAFLGLALGMMLSDR